MLISYTQMRRVGDEIVASRRKTLGYSLTSPRVAPVDFDAPAAKHEEDQVTREADGDLPRFQ